MEATPFEVGAPAGPDELVALAPILGAGFGVPLPDVPGWIERAGAENVRVVRARAAGRAVPVGALLQLPMGQWFAGRRVPMTGLAAVTIAPEHRGRGASDALLRAFLRETRARGTALSTLYPSTLHVYRRLGWEVAGARWETRVPLAALALRRFAADAADDAAAAALEVRPATLDDQDALATAHRAQAARANGHLDRNAYMWMRIRRPYKELEAHGWIALGRSGPEGYAFTVARRGDRLRFELRVTDLVALTTAAARRLLTLLGSFRSIAETAVLPGGPAEPVLAHLADDRNETELKMPWMVRVVDAPAALAARGWPEDARGTLNLALEDDVLPENAGRFLLEVDGGRAEVRAGGEGRLRLGPQGLAALYTGFRTPADLCIAGLADGPARDLRLAAALFATGVPSMPDHF